MEQNCINSYVELPTDELVQLIDVHEKVALDYRFHPALNPQEVLL